MPLPGFLLRVSRPRFWIYVFGPYIIGIAAGAEAKEDFLRFDVLIFALFFLFPANLLIYGVNDIFDFETDRLNPKKAEYELLVRPEAYRKLIFWIVLLNLPFIAAALFLAFRALPSLAGFILLSVFYSIPPIRAKEIPFLDSFFNVLYVFPGAFAYQMLTGSFPSIAVILAAGSWTAAMHAYSAIADIDADRKAGLRTIATALGFTGTHVFCTMSYIVAGFLALTFAPPVMLLGLVYVALIRFSSTYSTDRKGVFKVYRIFPFVNAASGFILFWYVAWPKFF